MWLSHNVVPRAEAQKEQALMGQGVATTRHGRSPSTRNTHAQDCLVISLPCLHGMPGAKQLLISSCHHSLSTHGLGSTLQYNKNRRRVSPDYQVTLQSERIPKDHETWQSTSSNHGNPEVGSWIPHGRQPGEDSCEGTVNQGYCSWERTAAAWGGTYTDTANHRKRWSTHA